VRRKIGKTRRSFDATEILEGPRYVTLRPKPSPPPKGDCPEFRIYLIQWFALTLIFSRHHLSVFQAMVAAGALEDRAEL
jgi:hypothetical protein